MLSIPLQWLNSEARGSQSAPQLLAFVFVGVSFDGHDPTVESVLNPTWKRIIFSECWIQEHC